MRLSAVPSDPHPESYRARTIAAWPRLTPRPTTLQGPRELKRYDLRYDGRTQRDLSEPEITALFLNGTIDRHTDCRASGTNTWRSVDDHLPLLKWGTSPTVPSRPGAVAASTSTADAVGSRQKISLVLMVCLLLINIGLLLYLASPLREFLRQEPGATTDQPRSAESTREMPIIRESPRASTQIGTVHPYTRHDADRTIVVPARPSTTESNPRGTIYTAPAQPKPALKPQPPPTEEVTIPLQEWMSVSTRYGSFSVKIVDHGPVTFTVWINGEFQGRRLEKIKGFETTGTNITPIHHLTGADVYFVDRISVSVGYCVLKTVPRS